MGQFSVEKPRLPGSVLSGNQHDALEQNEFIGEDAGLIEHPMEGSSVKNTAAFVFATQKQQGISDRTLLARAKVSPHTLTALREGKHHRNGQYPTHLRTIRAPAAETTQLQRGVLRPPNLQRRAHAMPPWFESLHGIRQTALPIPLPSQHHQGLVLEELKRLRDRVGGRNKLAELLGVSGPYLGRVLRGEKPS